MIDLAKLKNEQLRLSRKIVIRDDFSKITTVAGCDIAYTPKKIISVIVVCDINTMKIKEQKYTITDITFPYIKGFLSYREAPATVETYHKLEINPNILIIEGNGILHPMRMGLASHIGLLVDKPTIGVTKNLLCGEEKDSTIYIEKEAVGKVIETKEWAKPIYVSPGHMVSLKTAGEIVKKTLSEHKMPEPLHLAHKYAMKIKRKLKENGSNYLESMN